MRICLFEPNRDDTKDKSKDMQYTDYLPGHNKLKSHCLLAR